MIWDTLAFDPDNMRYSCSSVAGLHRYYWGGKKTKYFERICWECPLRYEEGLGIFADKLYPRKSGPRSLESGASSVFEQAILSGIWLSRFRERCLFDF
ncbi:hypothetical protein FF2_029752 [Malus domestica]